MPYRESSIKIIPKPKSRVSLKINIAVAASGFCLLGAVVCFFVFYNQAKAFQEKNRVLDEEISSLNKEIKTDFKDQLEGIVAKLNSFNQLFKRHKISSRSFNFVGSVCHPQVQFLSFDLNVTDRRIVLKGITENFKTLGEQWLILRSHPEIKAADITGFNLNQNGKVDFGLSLLLANDIFDYSYFATASPSLLDAEISSGDQVGSTLEALPTASTEPSIITPDNF